MNSPSEKNTSDSLLQALLEKNTQDLAEIQLKPYTPTVYAIPDTIWTAMTNLLQNAVTFQPTLYQKLQPLATWEEVQSWQPRWGKPRNRPCRKPCRWWPRTTGRPCPKSRRNWRRSKPAGDVPTTGWEGARAVYFQAVRRVLRLEERAGGLSAADGAPVAAASPEVYPWGCCSPGPWPAGHCGCCCGD